MSDNEKSPLEKAALTAQKEACQKMRGEYGEGSVILGGLFLKMSAEDYAKIDVATDNEKGKSVKIKLADGSEGTVAFSDLESAGIKEADNIRNLEFKTKEGVVFLVNQRLKEDKTPEYTETTTYDGKSVFYSFEKGKERKTAHIYLDNNKQLMRQYGGEEAQKIVVPPPLPTEAAQSATSASPPALPQNKDKDTPVAVSQSTPLGAVTALIGDTAKAAFLGRKGPVWKNKDDPAKAASFGAGADGVANAARDASFLAADSFAIAGGTVGAAVLGAIVGAGGLAASPAIAAAAGVIALGGLSMNAARWVDKVSRSESQAVGANTNNQKQDKGTMEAISMAGIVLAGGMTAAGAAFGIAPVAIASAIAGTVVGGGYMAKKAYEAITKFGESVKNASATVQR